MAERMKAYAPGEEVVFGLEFEYEGNREIETVEAVFIREGSGGEIAFLGDVRKGLPTELGRPAMLRSSEPESTPMRQPANTVVLASLSGTGSMTTGISPMLRGWT